MVNYPAMKTAFLLCNGILVNPLKADAWVRRWATKLQSERNDVVVDSLDYFSTPLIGSFFENSRVRRFRELLQAYKGCRIIVAAHSNGCDVVTRAVAESDVPVAQVHLLSAAIPADFNKNHLNQWLVKNPESLVYLYNGGRDWALRIGMVARQVIGCYGGLGYFGPKNIAPEAKEQVETHTFQDFGHGDWFKPAGERLVFSLLTHRVWP